MKTYKIISIAALAIAMTACTSEEASTSQPVVSGGGIPFRATVSTGTTTRAVTENTTDQKLETGWTVGEQVALIHNDVVDVMKVSEIDDATKTATITGSITGSPANGDDVTVVYPASAVDSDTKAVKTDLLAAQDGTLATISSNLDLCESSGAKLKVGAGVASLNGMVKLAPQMSIVKFSLSDGTDPLTTKSFVIKDGEDNVVTTVTAASELSDLFIAMAPATDATYSFSAVVGDFFWLFSKTGVTLKAGTYYKSPITMTISKKAGEISYATTSISKTFGDDNFTNPLTITGDGTVSYSSSDTKVAEVNSETGEVTIKGAGETTIKATVADGPTYTYAITEATYTLTVAKATMTVTAEGYTGTYDGSAHGITVTAPTDATVKYGTSAGTYDKTASPTYTNADTYTVYYQVTKDNYNTVEGSATVVITKAAGEIKYTETSVTKNYGDVAFTNDTFSIIGDGVVTYTSSDTSVASVSNVSPNNGLVSILGTGIATITATVADSENYAYAKKTAEYTIVVKPQVDGRDPFDAGDTDPFN